MYARACKQHRQHSRSMKAHDTIAHPKRVNFDRLSLPTTCSPQKMTAVAKLSGAMVNPVVQQPWTGDAVAAVQCRSSATRRTKVSKRYCQIPTLNE